MTFPLANQIKIILLYSDNPSERKDDVQQERNSVSSAQLINVTVKVKHIHQSARLSALISLIGGFR